MALREPDPTDISSLLAARLRAVANEASEQWRGAAPTPTRTVAIDDLLPESLCATLHRDLAEEPQGTLRRDDFRERKSTLTALQWTSPDVQKATMAFQHTEVVAAIAQITGITALEADPALYAAGISWMRPGDFLNPHIDNSHDRHRQRYRRLNLLYYLTPEWQEADSGALELWDPAVRHAVKIPAVSNRLVIMETHRGSWHSVQPVTGTGTRICLSNYYFSAESPEHPRRYFHVTSFMGRPEQRWRRLVCRLDNRARQFVAQVFRAGRNRNRVFDPSAQGPSRS